MRATPLLFTAALACTSIAAPAPQLPQVSPPPLVGTWCPMSEHGIYAFNQTEHSLDEVLAAQRQWRQWENLRFEFAADGTMKVGSHTGTWLATEHDPASRRWALTTSWRTEAPLLPAGELVLTDQEGWAGVELDWGSGWVVLAPADFGGCFSSETASLDSPDAPYTPPPATQVAAEKWLSKPTNSWPQLVLTHAGRFTGERVLTGASAFLIDHRGRALMGTAKHLVGPAGGVEPAVPLAELDEAVQDWVVHPRTRPDRAASVGALAMSSGTDAEALDWLFTEVSAHKALPAKTLHLRDTPVALNERVYLVGCMYAEPDCKQAVYPGRVTGRRGDHKFRYHLDQPVQLQGFSGAPILDANGHVVGTMSIGFSVFRLGRWYVEGGGQDASAAVPLIE